MKDEQKNALQFLRNFFAYAEYKPVPSNRALIAAAEDAYECVLVASNLAELAKKPVGSLSVLQLLFLLMMIDGDVKAEIRQAVCDLIRRPMLPEETMADVVARGAKTGVSDGLTS